MDLEEAPESIRKFVGEIACPGCSTKKADGIIVVVSFQQPTLWMVQAHCLKCATKFGWTLYGPPPAPKEDAVPLPDWVRGLTL
jgi:hypothetical protein